MRVESSVTSVSWIPSECIEGMPKLPFSLGVTHYDAPPPDQIEDLEQLRLNDRFRFANELRAWIDVDGGRIRGYGQTGGGRLGSTRVRFGPTSLAFGAVAFPDQRPAPRVGDDRVQFRQTAGGRTGLAAPRHVIHPPFVKISAPTAWTTLALTLYADGRSEHQLVGASPFPRHWIYDRHGRLVEKTGLVRFQTWWEEAFERDTPWGEPDAPTLVTAAESELERTLSVQLMDGPTRHLRTLQAGDTLVEQGTSGDTLFLLLDGVLSVVRDGVSIAQLGPGAIAGEGALLGDGKRTASLHAVTRCRVLLAAGDQVMRGALAELGRSRQPSEAPPGPA